MALEPAGVAFIAENLDQYIRDLSKADGAQLGLGDSAEKSSGGLGILGGVITGVATAVTTFAIDAVMKLSQAFVGLAQDSIGVAAEFESSMAVLGIAASSTGLQMDELSEAALAVGGDTRLLGVSASGAAGAMTGLFKAGLTSQEVFGDLQGYMDGTAQLGGTLRASIDLAAASSLDMVQAADLAAITLATFGHEAEAAGMSTDEWVVQAMDNLVRTADASVAEVEGLQAALTNVGPTAAAFGFSMADVNTSLALLSTRGIQGSEAGTALKSMFTNMMRTTPKVTGALEELGVVLYDNNGVMLSIPEIMGQFEVAMEGLTDQQKNQYIQTIAGTYGMKTMQTLLGEGIQGWNDMEQAIGGAATMMEQGEARSQTLAAQQEALDGVIETLKIRIGSALLPALTGMTTIFADLVDKYGPLVSEAFERIGAVLGDLVNWFVVFLEDGDYLNDFLVNLPGPIQSIVKGLGEFLSAIDPLVTTLKQAFGGDTTGLMEGLAFSLDNLFGPERSEAIMCIVDKFVEFGAKVIETFGEAVEFVREHSQEFIGAIKGIGAVLAGVAIVSIITGIGTAIAALASPVAVVIAIGAALGAAWAGNWLGIRDIVAGLGQVFQAVFGTIKKVVVDTVWPALQEVWASIQEAFGTIREVLEELGINFDDTGSGIEIFVGIVTVVIEALGGIISGVLGGLTSTIKFFADVFREQWENILSIVQGVKEWLEGFKQFWTSLFEGDFPGALEGLEKAFKGTAKAIGGTVKLIVKVITTPFKGLYKYIEGFVKGIIDYFKNLKKKLVGGSIIPDMMDRIEKVIDTVLGIILKVWETVFEKILDVTQKIFESIERIVDRVMSAIEKIIDTICTAIGGDWGDFVDLLLELWEETWDNIRDFVDTVFSTIEALIDRIAGAIESLWNSFTDTLEEVWENAWSAIESFVDSTFNAIESLIDSIADSIESLWDSFTSSIQAVWETTWSAIESFVDTVFSAIESLMNSISGTIETAWNTFTSSIQTTWETIWDAIETFVDTTFSSIETLIDTISDSIQTTWDIFTSSVQTTWETIWSAIEGFVDTVFSNVGILIGTISDSIETAWGIFTGAIQSIWETVWNAIESFVNTVFGNVQTAIGTISDAIEGTWNSWIGRLRSAFETMFNALEGIVDTAMGLVDAAVESALSALASILAVGTDLYNGIMAIGHNIANSIRDGVIALWGNVKDAITGKLEDLGKVGAFVAQVWENVKELGWRIVSNIKDGLSSAWVALGGVVESLKNKLKALKDDLGSLTWAQVKEIGSKVVGWIKQGIINGWNAFVDWLKEMIIGIFGSGATSAMQATGEKGGRILMESIADGIYANAGVVIGALEQTMAGAGQVGDWTGTMTAGDIEAGVMQAAAGFSASLGLIAPAMMAPAAVSHSTEVNIGPVAINNGMDMAEFEVRVRQAVSEAI